MFKRISVVILAIALMGFFLAACSSSTPSESDGRKALEKKLEDYRNNEYTKNWYSWKIKSFKKTDGQLSEVFGVKGYVMQFEVVFELKDGKISERKGRIEFTKTEKGWQAGSIMGIW